MTRNHRFGLVGLAVAVVAIAFVLARPEESSEKADDPAPRAGQTAPSPAPEARPADGRDGGGPTATAESALPPPVVVRLTGGEPAGGIERIVAEQGEIVRFQVTSDATDEIHIHGYDVTRDVAPGRPARFSLTADIEGIFEIESHAAEDAGKEPLIARLVVEPA